MAEETEEQMKRMMKLMMSMIMMVIMIQVMSTMMKTAQAIITPPEEEEEEVTYEDFTTFTEVDPTDKITVESPTKVSFTNMTRADACYLYKDYGEGHFGNFEITCKITVQSCTTTGEAPHCKVIMLSDGIGNDIEDVSNYVDCLITGSKTENNKFDLELYKVVGGVATNLDGMAEGYPFTAPKTFYIRLKRDGGTLTMEVYNDEAMTDLVGSVSGDVSDVPSSFRYLEVAVSRNSTGTDSLSGSIENLRIVKAS